MENRFLEMEQFLRGTAAKRGRTSGTRPAAYASSLSKPARGVARFRTVWSQQFAASDRALVILIDNGGIDLGIPTLVEKVLSSVPGAGIIPDSQRKKLVEFIREKIKSLTDQLLESAELYVNRYSAAKPALFGDVIILRDGTSSYDDLKSQLFSLTNGGKIIDLFILTHGSGDYIHVRGAIDSAKIRAMKTALGKPLALRSVYMMNCVGSSLNQAWIDAGARVSSGALKNNYIPEPSMYFFWKNWQDGQTFENAVTSAYRKTINLMNDTVRGFIDGLPIPGTSALAKLIDFAEFEFVKDSAPVIQGLRSLTINSDDLSVSQTLSSGLATTVLPVSVLRSLSSDSGNLPQQISRQALSFLKMWEPEVDSARATEVQRNIIQCVTSPLSPNQNDALVSLVYSIGVDAFKESTLLKLINQGEHNSVPSEIKKWVKVRRENGVADDPELVKRREAEAGLYQRVDTPVPLAQSLSGLPVRYAYRYSSPASLGAYSYAQNPVAAAGAAISIADAASIGLATVSVVQAQAAASQGSFTLTFDKAQRILTTAARLKMTGARAPRSQYRRRLFYIGISRLNAAEADVIIEWEGNAYGEIGTAIIRKNIPTSTEWSKSSANISIVKKDHIPEGGDPRVWPIRFHYDGTYDPWGNGLFEFQGDFEINAFGGLHFIVHEVAKRAAINFALVGKAEDYVQKGDDVMVPVPSIPEEQLRYLKENLP